MINKNNDDQWSYIGDVNLEYGGTYFRFDPYYVEAIRVTDLDSATGANGLTLIERLTIVGIDDKERIEQALECVGMNLSDLRGKGKAAILIELAYALMSYGYYDVEQVFGNYTRAQHLVLVNSDYGPCSDKRNWDSWEVDKEETVKLHKKYGGDLEVYIDSELL